MFSSALETRAVFHFRLGLGSLLESLEVIGYAPPTPLTTHAVSSDTIRVLVNSGSSMAGRGLQGGQTQHQACGHHVDKRSTENNPLKAALHLPPIPNTLLRKR